MKRNFWLTVTVRNHKEDLTVEQTNFYYEGKRYAIVAWDDMTNDHSGYVYDIAVLSPFGFDCVALLREI